MSAPPRAADEAELAARLRARAPGDPPLMPWGSGCLSGRGYPPATAPVTVDVRALNRVVQHAAEDLVLTVETGLSWPALQATLARRGQWLPVLPFLSAPVTVGEVLAGDLRSPVAGYGAVGDYLLGVRFLNGRGEVVEGGGRVVKNVAGYALGRLLTGSLDTFGLVTQATFKVLPRPAEFGAVEFADLGAERTATLVETAALRLAAGGVVAWSERDRRGVTVFFGGDPARVGWQMESAAELGTAHRLTSSAALQRWRHWEDRTVSFRHPVGWGGGRPADLPGTFPASSSSPDDTLADLLRGHLWWFPADGERARAQLAGRRRRLPKGAHLHLDLPAGEQRPDAPWGREPGAVLTLLKNLKHTLDPDGGLPAGRLPGRV